MMKSIIIPEFRSTSTSDLIIIRENSRRVTYTRWREPEFHVYTCLLALEPSKRDDSKRKTREDRDVGMAKVVACTVIRAKRFVINIAPVGGERRTRNEREQESGGISRWTFRPTGERMERSTGLNIPGWEPPTTCEHASKNVETRDL